MALGQYPSSSYLSSTTAALQPYTAYQLLQHLIFNYLIALRSTLALLRNLAVNYYLVCLAYKLISNGPWAVPQQQLPQQYYSSALAVYSILAFIVPNNLAVLAAPKHLATLDLRKTSNRSIIEYWEIPSYVYYAEQPCLQKFS